MIPIKITAGNTSKIQAAIDAVQTSSALRTIAARDVFAACAAAASSLEASKTHGAHTIICDLHAAGEAAALTAVPERTRFAVERDAAGEATLLAVSRGGVGGAELLAACRESAARGSKIRLLVGRNGTGFKTE